MGGHKLTYGIAFALLLAGVGYLIISGLSTNSVYFLNVSEALAKGLEADEQARLFGRVDPANLRRDAGMTGIEFNLADKDSPGKTIRVSYSGAVPDTFKPGVEVIVEGSMEVRDNLFAAHTLMTKCPSKYKKELPEASAQNR